MTTPQDPFAAPQGPPPAGYGPPSSGWAQQPPQQWAGAPQTDSKAIVALVFAILSFVFIPVLLAIVALVLARSSKRDIVASGGRLGGESLVTAARIISWINIGLAALVVVLVLLALLVFGVAGVSVSEG